MTKITAIFSQIIISLILLTTDTIKSCQFSEKDEENWQSNSQRDPSIDMLVECVKSSLMSANKTDYERYLSAIDLARSLKDNEQDSVINPELSLIYQNLIDVTAKLYLKNTPPRCMTNTAVTLSMLSPRARYDLEHQLLIKLCPSITEVKK